MEQRNGRGLVVGKGKNSAKNTELQTGLGVAHAHHQGLQTNSTSKEATTFNPFPLSVENR